MIKNIKHTRTNHYFLIAPPQNRTSTNEKYIIIEIKDSMDKFNSKLDTVNKISDLENR